MYNMFILSNCIDGFKVINNLGEELYFNSSLKKLIQNLCIQNGSSIKGRLESFKKLTASYKKPCIMINKNLILIPITSFNCDDCTLLNYNRIVHIKQIENKTQVLFDNGLKYIVNCNYRIINKQLKRCDKYIELLNSFSFKELL